MLYLEAAPVNPAAMAIIPYLKEHIDDQASIQPMEPWREKNIFPVFLRNMYRFYEMTILGTNCILLEIIDEQPRVDVLQKHIKRIKELANQQSKHQHKHDLQNRQNKQQQIVLYYKYISWYRRKSLIENRIAFVIGDGQMYMPFLGLNLKNMTQQREIETEKIKKTFTASAQLAYLYFLYNKEAVVNATEFAEKMGISVMTASRALNDLHHAELTTCEIGGKTGRSKQYRRIPDPDYFQKGRELIKSPVKKVLYGKKVPEGAYIAGFEALAELSMINPPDHPVRAISGEELHKQEIETVRNKDIIEDEKLAEIEVWDYDPGCFADNTYVDSLSLYASLKDEHDERVEQALEEILRGETWYMG